MRKDEHVKEILQELEQETGMVYAYDHFEDENGEETEPLTVPYAVYRRTASRNFGADGKVFYRGRTVELEIYAATPDEMAELMDRVECMLDEHEMFYGLASDTVYISQEKIYGTLYEI